MLKTATAAAKTKSKDVSLQNSLSATEMIRRFGKLKGTWSPPALVDESAMRAVIERAGLERYKGKTILEMNPGPGEFSIRLANIVRPKNYIVLEPRPKFASRLEEIKRIVSEHSVNFQTVYKDGYEWTTFADLEVEGLLDASLIHPVTEVNPNLLFIASPHLEKMEQLVSQWMDTLGNRSWIQKYGRVKMLIFVSQALKARILGKMGNRIRGRLTIMCEGTSIVREILHNPWEKKGSGPWQINYKDEKAEGAMEVSPSIFHPDAALSLLEFTPLKTPRITAPWATFEYVVRLLFINRSTALSKQVKMFSPGAWALLKDLPKEMHAKTPDQLTVEEIDTLAWVFERWPFRPRFLIDESYEEKDRKSASDLRRFIRDQGESYF